MDCDIPEALTFAISSRPIETGVVAVVLHLYSDGMLVQKGMVTTCSRREASIIVRHSRSYLLALGLREWLGSRHGPISAARPATEASMIDRESFKVSHSSLTTSICSSITERLKHPDRPRRLPIRRD